MVKRASGAWLLTAALVLLAACEPELKNVDAPTQIMLRIYNDDDVLLGQMKQLRAQLYMGKNWNKRAENVLSARSLVWPVDLPVLPAKGEDFARFEVIVEAIGEGGKVLAQTRAVTSFVPNDRKVLELWLFACPTRGLGYVCAADGCHGSACEVCTRPLGNCERVGETDSDRLPYLDAGWMPAAPDSMHDAATAGEIASPSHDSGAPSWQDAGGEPASRDDGGGVCTSAVSGCADCPAGSHSSGSTLNRCVDVNECTNTTVCTADYPCANTQPFYRCRGQFPEWNVSAVNNFSANHGVVTDALTGLEWQQVVDGTSYDWAGAKTYCDSLALDSKSDWRLPTIAELRSIVDYGKYSPAIDTTAFPNTPSAVFWSASTYVGAADRAWYIYFSFGLSSSEGKSAAYRVRCVR